MMGKYEWLEGLGCLFHVLVLIVGSSVTVTLFVWLTRLLFGLFGLL